MVEQQIRFEVIRTYYGVLVAHTKRGVSEEAVKMAESDMKRIQDRFKSGLVVESDLLAAEVRLARIPSAANRFRGGCGDCLCGS